MYLEGTIIVLAHGLCNKLFYCFVQLPGVEKMRSLSSFCLSLLDLSPLKLSFVLL